MLNLPMVGGMPFIAGAGSFANEELPEYHSGMLEVKFHTDSGPIAAAMAMGGGPMLTRSMAASSSGTGALLAFERSGLIRRVTPLADFGSDPSAETPMLGALSASFRAGTAGYAGAAGASVPADPNQGVSLVELYEDADIGVLTNELRQDPAVESVSRVPVRYLVAKKKSARVGAAPAAAAPSTSALWNLNKIRWSAARARPGFQEATTIKVAVLDTGIDSAHPDLNGLVAGYEFTHPTTGSASTSRDLIGHGTHVAGTIAAKINNSVGINGICKCSLFAWKIFDDRPDWYPSKGYFAYFVEPVMYLRALSRCLTLGMNVVNLSIGGGGAPSAQESSLFAQLIASGASVVAAMGNENSPQLSYPAAIPGVIAVGATTINDNRASFSNYGSHISLCAPGVGIWSTLPTYAGNQGFRPKPTFPPQVDPTRPLLRDTDYASWDGTSMASPHVAAAAALLLANKGPLTPVQVKQKLKASAAKVPGMAGQAFTNEYGAGRLDLFQLLK